MKTLPEFEPAGFLGFSSCSHYGFIINLGTWGIPFWSLSHVALVAEHPDDGHLVLFESTTLDETPCLFQGRSVDGVQCHEIVPRVLRYPGKVWYYPRVNPITPEQSIKLTQFCVDHLGVAYDAVGAFRSRGAGFGWLEKRLFSHEDLTSVFCSEFEVAAENHIGAFHTGNASKWNPNSSARAHLRRGISLKPLRLK